MRSRAVGKSTLKVEVTNISPYGIWMIVDEKEYYLPYSEYPWFKEAKITEIFQVTLLNNTHLYWKNLDIDIDLHILNNLEKYPLVHHS